MLRITNKNSTSNQKAVLSNLQKNNNGLALNELEILRVILERDGLNIFDSSQIDTSFERIEEILKNPTFSQISSLVVLKQMQSTFALKNTASLYPSSVSLSNEKSESYPLHLAARKGDLNQVIKLVESGAKISQTDLFGSTPLHMAVMYGHKDVAEYLINKGANVNAKTYEYEKNIYYTPLDLALIYAPNTETVSLLLTKGVKMVYWDEPIFILLQALKNAEIDGDFKQFDLALSKLEVVGQVTKQALFFLLGEEDIPVAVFLENYAAVLDDIKLYDRVMECVHKFHVIDNEHIAERYVIAKNVLHAFPSEHNYKYKIGNTMTMISAESHFPIYTSTLAAQTLKDFQQQMLKVDTKTFEKIKDEFSKVGEPLLNDINMFYEFKQEVFHQLENTFNLAAVVTQKIGQYAYSEMLFNAYNQGQTILLPCGWDGHALGIILNQELNLFIVANAGDRFDTIKPGINAYHHEFPITADVIYNILNNTEKMDLEFKYYYDLGLYRDENYSKVLPEQIYGNCAWYSHQLSEQALLFLEISNKVENPSLALALSESWFKELDEFHKTSVLKAYLADPYLEVAMLGDILLMYHNKLSTPEEKERASLILDTLTSPEYKAEFTKYYYKHTFDISAELKLFIKDNGYHIGNSHQPIKTGEKEAALASHPDSKKTPIKLEDVIQTTDNDIIEGLDNTGIPTVQPVVIEPPIMPLSVALMVHHEDHSHVI